MRVLSYLPLFLLAGVVFWAGSPISADVVSVDLGLVAPSGSTNRATVDVDISYKVPVFGWKSDSDSDTVDISGNMLTRLWANFDANTQVATVTGMEFYGGAFVFSPIEMDFTFMSIANIHAVGTGIGGQFDTPSPPATISGTSFNLADHEVIINQGTFTTSGAYSTSFNMAESPVTGTYAGTGTISVGNPVISGNTATYSVSMIVPLAYDEDLDTGNPDLEVGVAASGTLVANGTFSRTFTIPVEEPDPPVVTLGIVDKGSEGGLHKYVLTATGQGITTLSQFTVSGAVHQVFHDGEPSEWRYDGSALESDKTDSHVIFGDLRLPDLGGTSWDYETYPDGPPDKITQEIIYGGGNSGMGRLNNYNAELEMYDAYENTGTPSTNPNDVYELMQLVVKEGNGFTADVTLLTSIEHDPVTGESYIHKHNLSYTLPGPQTLLWPGDANNDYYVDELDAQALADHWLQSGGWEDGDFNNDGMVNDLDAVILAANWTGSPSASVPEPGVLALLAGALCFGLLRKRN